MLEFVEVNMMLMKQMKFNVGFTFECKEEKKKKSEKTEDNSESEVQIEEAKVLLSKMNFPNAQEIQFDPKGIQDIISPHMKFLQNLLAIMLEIKSITFFDQTAFAFRSSEAYKALMIKSDNSEAKKKIENIAKIIASIEKATKQNNLTFSKDNQKNFDDFYGSLRDFIFIGNVETTESNSKTDLKRAIESRIPMVISINHRTEDLILYVILFHLISENNILFENLFQKNGQQYIALLAIALESLKSLSKNKQYMINLGTVKYLMFVHRFEDANFKKQFLEIYKKALFYMDIISKSEEIKNLLKNSSKTPEASMDIVYSVFLAMKKNKTSYIAE